MTTFLLQDTATSALSLITGDIPLDVSTLVSSGSYRVWTVSDPSDVLLTIGEAEIVGATLPAMSALYEGQAVQEVTDYPTMVDPANYTCSLSGETVTALEVSVQGDAAAVDAPLAEGATAGFTVSVTGSQGTTADFVAAPVTVDYKFDVTLDSDNTFAIDVNPRVPGDEPLDITITEEPWASRGTFPVQVTKTQLAAGPANLVPLSAGFAGTGIGGALTVGEGLWLYDASLADPAVTYTLQADGADVSGFVGVDLATINAYTVAASEQGKTLTVIETVTDANGTRSVTSAGTAIPAAGGGPVVTEVEALRDDHKSSRTTADVTAAGITLPAKEILILVGATAGNDDLSGLSATFGGTGLTRRADTSALGATGYMAACFTLDLTGAGGDTTADLVFSNGGSLWKGCSWAAWSVEGGDLTALTSAGDLVIGFTDPRSACDVGLDVAAGETILGLLLYREVEDADAGDEVLGMTGLTAGAQVGGIGSKQPKSLALTGRHAATAAETPRTITMGHGSTDSTLGDMAALAVAIPEAT